MNKRKIFIYTCLVIGLILIVLGIFLVICSFKHEVLDGKYIVEKATEFTFNKKPLSKGQVSVTKDVKYVSKGTYEIIFKINYNQEDESILFADKSKVIITDIIGDGYKLDTDKVYINKDPIKLYSYNTVTSDYVLNYNNNTFEIMFPKDKIFKYNTIVLYVKLVDRDVNKKYVTSKESYYSFTPNIKNDFYEKKAMQSYVIDGSGYIVLQNT